MAFLELERSAAAYRADFAFYGLAVVALVVALVAGAPEDDWPLPALVVGGYLLWSLMEYGLHRFVLHRVPPFRRMHEQHHLRPLARIGTPTVVSAPLFALGMALPAWALMGPWPAMALMLGVLGGYLAYSAIHHLCHHGRGETAWLIRRQRWHGRHHVRALTPGCFGVSHGGWDHVFGTARGPAPQVGGPYRRLG